MVGEAGSTGEPGATGPTVSSSMHWHLAHRIWYYFAYQLDALLAENS